MNKKNKKSFDLIKKIIEQPKLEKVLNSTEQEQLETEIYKIAIDNELQEKTLADKNKWIVELLNEIERLKNDKKKALNYINQEMYVDTNPTICEMEDEENTIIELPISLNLYNEDLRKLLELLEEK